ncbi:MAG: hypothetical protein EOS73_24710 [Mesorhizobium sp.]|uniref:hypothetical protein n=1 Tax=Mesorhizobium sp. M7A.F.Ca.ET.027.02.1.1 TaxID=2496655 RepID=UPI000FD47370|nr:hypothetical protein [Mesorhizobium sp. M7A.F.Ca.ET.027.02.1.1]RVD14620.1 hypothetical protein EN749_19010 [Mesorhizobium sp. M7A.F.Ca.ET.027.02.1.1]RWD00987.1 MAG: hypothetical protein EOS73_24710 [Mesorhizobium sp.]
MQDEATRRKWREYKSKWRAENPERNRELDSRAYHRNRETINRKRKEVRKLFTEWRQTLKPVETPAQ